MSRPRRRTFGPLFYSTLILAVLVGIYAAVLNAPPWLDGIARARVERARAEGLRKSIRDPRGEVRARAYHSLVEAWGEPSEMLPMLAAAAGDGDGLVRLEVARGLGRLGQAMPTPEQRGEARRVLRRLLEDPASEIRAEAAGALAILGPDPATAAALAAAAADDDRNVRSAAAQALVKLNGPDDPAAARALVDLVASPDAVPDRPEALRVIRTMGEAVQDRAVAALAKLISHGDPDIVPEVIACLPEAGPRARAAVPALEALLDHDEPGLRAGAAMAIVAIEDPDGFRSLNMAVSGGAAPGMMVAMAGGGGMAMRTAGAGTANPPAGAWANPRVVAILSRLVGDASIPPETRMTALGMLRSASATAAAKASAALVHQLADPDPNVRRTAIELLSQVVEVTPVELPAAPGAKSSCW